MQPLRRQGDIRGQQRSSVEPAELSSFSPSSRSGERPYLCPGWKSLPARWTRSRRHIPCWCESPAVAKLSATQRSRPTYFPGVLFAHLATAVPRAQLRPPGGAAEIVDLSLCRSTQSPSKDYTCCSEVEDGRVLAAQCGSGGACSFVEYPTVEGACLVASATIAGPNSRSAKPVNKETSPVTRGSLVRSFW